MKKTKRLTIRQILRKAARIIEKHGWTRGAYKHHERYCMYGAVRMAAFGTVDIPSDRYRNLNFIAYNTATRLLMDRGYTTGWNDDVPHKSNVIVALLETADILRRH